LSGPFAQLLRYTAPADARRTTVLLRSAATASPLTKAYWGMLAVERKSALNIGKKVGEEAGKKVKKLKKNAKNVPLFEQKVEKS